jgi:predicted ATPase
MTVFFRPLIRQASVDTQVIVSTQSSLLLDKQKKTS